LAGLLIDQEREVLRAYRARGLRLAARRRLSGWSILVLRRP
jgi:ribosomal protein L11 methylase PrmA